MLRGWKSPSPDAAAKIAQVLGADGSTVRRARRRAEELREWKQRNPRGPKAGSRTSLDAVLAPAVEALIRALGERGQGSAQPETGPDSNIAGFPILQLVIPDVTVKLVIGDLLDQDTHLAVGFSDTFDTDITGDRIIHSASLQGQLLRRLFGGHQQQLDEQISGALNSVLPVHIESRGDKAHGKLARYPLGTVAVLGEPARLIFAVAYRSMGNDIVVRAPVQDLWYCYSQLWDAMYRHGQRGVLSIPLMGSELARLDTLGRENLLRLILLSFVAYSRSRVICHELRIVICPDDARRIDPVNLRAFLQDLLGFSGRPAAGIGPRRLAAWRSGPPGPNAPSQAAGRALIVLVALRGTPRRRESGRSARRRRPFLGM